MGTPSHTANRTHALLLLVIAATLLLISAGPGQATVTFTDVGASLPMTAWGSPAWGDYDCDGDLDLVLTHPGYWEEVAIYAMRNNGSGGFSPLLTSLPGVVYGALAWGDYDNDGDPDLALIGNTVSGLIARIYRNDGNWVFTDIGAGLPGVRSGSLAWGDYDNDGDLDLVLTGRTASSSLARIYRNDGGGTFSDIGAGLPGVSESFAAWGDYDNDGDLDLLLTGLASSGVIARVYRNDGAGAFVDVNAGLVGVRYSSAAWGDYDSDGDLDLALIGDQSGDDVWVNYGSAGIYRNDGGGVFTNINAGLTRAYDGSVSWADYDNDGYLDLVITGLQYKYVTRYTQLAGSYIYHNNGDGTFANINAGLPHAYHSTVAWGDYDKDGDLDLLLAGVEEVEGEDWGAMARIYGNDGAPTNTRPNAPTNLAAQVSGDHLTLTWNAATDDYTPPAGLSYNIRVGTVAGGIDLVSPMAHYRNGFRRVTQIGNAQQRTLWTIQLPPWPRKFYCSVQAIDGAFAGSAFATEAASALAPGESPGVVYPATIDFGNVAVSPTETRTGSFMVGNAGTAALSGAISESCDYFETTGGAGAFTLQPGETLHVEVTFHPTVMGNHTCVVDTGCESCPNVTCHGYAEDTTPIGLSAGAWWTGSAVEVTWTVPGEQQASDFDVQREDQRTGSVTRLSPNAIQKLGSSFRLSDDTVEPGRTYAYTVVLRERGLPTAKAATVVQVPRVPHALLQNQPNPFTTLTRMPFVLATESQVRLEVLDIQGRLVRTLVNEKLRGGYHSQEWNGRNARGEAVPGGLYFYRLTVEGGPRLVRKAMLLR